MHVAFVHPDFPGAEGTGATHTATVIVRTLAARGHDVTVFCRTSPDAASVEHAGMSTAAAPAGTDVELRDLSTSGPPYHTATSLNRALQASLRAGAFDDFDVVHSYLPSSLPALGAIGDATDATTVLTLNAYGAVCPKNDLRYMDDRRCQRRGLLRCTACSLATSGGHEEFGAAYRSASRLGNLGQIRAGLRRLDGVDRFQALSPHVRSVYEEFGFPSDRIRVVPNPLDDRFRRSNTATFDAPYRLLHVGSLDPHKGVDRLVPMLRRLRESGLETTLTVVGDGGRRDRLAAAAREQGVDEFLTLQGHRPYAELPGVYAAHDLFVYPGEWAEPFGRVFLEALATGTPVVGTDVGVVADIVGDAGVVTDRSAADLARGVRTAVRDRGLAVLSARCEQRLEPYRPDRVVRELESLYRGAGGSGSAGGRA